METPQVQYSGEPQAAGVRELVFTMSGAARFGNACETASLIWNSALQKFLRLEAAPFELALID